ncbi:DUF2239 family protein [Brevundimonas sp.]|uniref:DUF2239 family protein n=1 Tax=Brevundimonas sp. TaxID=1871086 RepID=UPI00351D46B5
MVAREVTLPPRHWEWLAGQPGGASTALRRLVEAALQAGEGPDRSRRTLDRRFQTSEYTIYERVQLATLEGIGA